MMESGITVISVMSLLVKNSIMVNYKKSIHEGVTYDCDQCEYQATTKGHLTTHKQSRHVGIRYNCDQCNGTFNKKSIMVHHKKSKCVKLNKTKFATKQHKLIKRVGIK